MMGKKKRPMVEWLRWARKPFLFLFYSLGAVIFGGLERLEALMGGKPRPSKPVPEANKLTITFSTDAGEADLILPFVPLFGVNSKWFKLKPERVFREIRVEGGALTYAGQLYGRSAGEGVYGVGGLALLGSRADAAAFLEDSARGGLVLRIVSALASRRTSAVPHAKGVLLKMAVGSRKVELAMVRGGERLLGEPDAGTAGLVRSGLEYHHLFLAAVTPSLERTLPLLEERGKAGGRLSVYACLNLSFDTLTPVFLFEPPAENVRMEDAALVLLAAAPVSEPAASPA